jgi:hypothetical protein
LLEEVAVSVARRDLLKMAGATGVGVLAAHKTFADGRGAETEGRVVPEAPGLSAVAWAGHVGQRLRILDGPFAGRDLVLRSVEPAPGSVALGFSCASAQLPQGAYVVGHTTLGTFALFLAPASGRISSRLVATL